MSRHLALVFMALLVLLAGGLALTRGARAQDPAPPAEPDAASAPATPTAAPSEPEPAPVPPAGAVGLIIANKAAGFKPGFEKKAVQALFRGNLQTTPSGDRVLIYLLPVHDVAIIDVLSKALGWNENVFEQQIPTIEASMGRIYYKRLHSSAEVLKAVCADKGAVGMVSADTVLTPDVVILWPAVTP